MSRLIVKNIPTNITEAQLKKIFEAKGEVTDVKIIFKGTQNRRFCFVGFKNAPDAEKAQKFFNNTFIHLSRVRVEMAHTADDPQLPRPWSKYSKQPSKAETPPQKVSKKAVKEEKSKKFKEFLEVMKKNSTSVNQMAWNDDVDKRDLEENQAQKAASDDIDRIFENATTAKKLKSENETQQQAPQPGVNSCRLYVTNIPYTSTDADLRQVFEKFGTVVSLKVPKSKGGSLSGFCFIQYALPEEAMRAFVELDNKIVLGRILHVKPAYEDDKKELQAPVIEEKSSYKKFKKQEMLERLNDSTQWNTLFLNPNTIIESIAQKYGLEKKEILAEDNEDMAVKMAQMETQIIKETRTWLKSVGLNIDFLKIEKGLCERSKRTIFVKNIQFRIVESDLHELFARYGKLNKVLLSPNKSIGIVCYEDEPSAANAFTALSNYKFKGALLYLEWAPKTLMNEEVAKTAGKGENEEDDSLTRILYVKNLNFSTTEKGLHKLFSQKYDDVIKVTIAKREGMSQGYGFVEFKSPESAAKALRQLNNVILDDHALQLSQSKPKPKVESKERKGREEVEPTNKLIFRNLPFESTAQELRKLIRQYGELKKLRLPKKLDGSIRGFAFAEFVNVEEAQNVMESLQSTHFYGRRLVIEFSKEEQ